MKINIVSTKLIKPSIPTPKSLTKYKISLADEILPPTNICILLFYPSKVEPLFLEESFARVLVQFYPLAGRYIKTSRLVDCSDQGAEFVEAKAVDVELMDLVGIRYNDQLSDLLPCQSTRLDEAATNPLLSVQITEFKCGGMVIGVSISHRIFDTSSVGTFIAAWSNASVNPGPEMEIRPSFDSPSLFPGSNDQGPLEFELSENPGIVVKKFSFNKEAITSLKAKLALTEGLVSRVRVVCAVMARAFITMDQKKHGKSRPFLVGQALSIRQRTNPPLPKHSCGNLAIPSYTQCMDVDETSDIGVEELVRLIGDATHKTINDCSKILAPGLLMNTWMKFIETSMSIDGVRVMFTDWSKFGFYKADFGSGKPVWTSIGHLEGENVVVLMDNKEGDGIEAWVHLKSDELYYLEQDEGIRQYTT